MEEMDITDEVAVNKIIKEINPDVVIHCAAWTAVDAAEDEENVPKVMAVNATGTENIAKVCNEINCKMVYISTDYVFNGQERLRGSRRMREILLMCTEIQNI